MSVVRQRRGRSLHGRGSCRLSGSWALTLRVGVRGPVAELVGIEGGVVSGVFNLESSDVGASDRRPRHEERYHEVGADGETTEWKSKVLRTYQRRTLVADALIASAYLAGTASCPPCGQGTVC